MQNIFKLVLRYITKVDFYTLVNQSSRRFQSFLTCVIGKAQGSSELMTSEVRINDLFERFVQSNIRGKVVDCVQDIISSGIRGEVVAEHLKSAEIQVITLGPRLFLWNLPGRLHFSREDWLWLLAVLPTDYCNDRTVRDDFSFPKMISC